MIPLETSSLLSPWITPEVHPKNAIPVENFIQSFFFIREPLEISTGSSSAIPSEIKFIKYKKFEIFPEVRWNSCRGPLRQYLLYSLINYSKIFFLISPVFFRIFSKVSCRISSGIPWGIPSYISGIFSENVPVILQEYLLRFSQEILCKITQRFIHWYFLRNFSDNSYMNICLGFASSFKNPTRTSLEVSPGALLEISSVHPSEIPRNLCRAFFYPLSANPERFLAECYLAILQKFLFGILRRFLRECFRNLFRFILTFVCNSSRNSSRIISLG